MRHGRGRASAVPMLRSRSEPHDITGTDFLDRPTPALNASAAEGHDESLPQRVRVPCGPSAKLERDARTPTRAGSGARNRGSIRTAPVNHSVGPTLEDWVPIL